MSEHTPTPWRVEEGTDLIWGACNPDDRTTYGMGYSIVQGKSGAWGARQPDMDEREANAAFIVKAVNNHDALVSVLEKIAGKREYEPADHEAAARYKREEGLWTTDEYLADSILASVGGACD